MRKKFLLMTFLTLLFTAMGTSVLRAQVAKVGNTEYATIDEAIANWANNTTLTLLDDVTLSDVIQLSSQEHHYLEVGEFTMTAASGKNAIEIKSYGRSNRSESGALTITADDTNPGGIEAASKSCIYYKYDATLANDQYDRPIIYIIGGVFGGSSYSGISSTGHSSAQDKCATFNISGGIFNCSLNLTKTKLITSGGTFHGSVSCTGGSTSTRVISGGTFKSFGFMTADASSKFAVGSAINNYNVGMYVDNNGYLVVGGPVVDEPNTDTNAGIVHEASTANYGGWSTYLQYSSAATNGLYYTSVEEALADNNKTTGSVTVYVDELDMTGISYKGTIVVPADHAITITNAPATLVVKDEHGNVLEPNANGSYTTIVPQGNNFTGYTRTDAIWGEVWGNAYESFVIKVLDTIDGVMGTTSLNNVDGIINGNVNVTWSLKLDAASNTDEYWDMSWATAPTIDNMPVKVELWVDGFKVSGGNVVLNGPDNLNMIYAAVTDADGKIYSYHTSIAEAITAINNTRSVTPPNVIALLRDTNEEVTLPAGITLNLNDHTAPNVSVPVASVNGTTYTDLQDAIVAAAPDGIVEILSDVTVDEWIMFSETLNVGSGQIITMNINGLTINGNGKTVTINSIESAGNGNRLFYDATKLNINNWTIKYADGVAGGIGLTSGTIEGVTFDGGTYGVFPGANGVTIENCTFNGTKSSAVYYEEGRQGIVVNNNSFNTADGAYAITMRSNEQFTGNIINKGRVNIANSSSATVTGNDFGQERFKVYNAATATIENNEINVLAFNDNSVVFSTFGVNTLSTEAQTVLNGALFPVAQIGTTKYGTLEAAFEAATEGQTITLLADATPDLTSQRAITKAAVIDLGGKTLTLKEDDLYFGTTEFKNGNIIVDPSVRPSTAVFWMFANQTLTFDNVKIVATGVTGTYLIGLDGNNSDLNLLNGSEIVVENTTALDLDIICVNASTGNDIKVENSKVNVTNLDGRVFFRGNYTVKDSEVNLAGITKAGFRIEAGQTLSIEGNSVVTITGEPRDGGIHLTDLTAIYTKAETATVNATVNEPKVAKVGENTYRTLALAVAAVEDGGTITLIANETFTTNNRYDNGGWWDGLGYSGDKSFTIDLANFTISQDGALNDYLMWFKNDGAKANTITLKNGTLDAGTTAFSALATASSNAQKITVNLENIKVINNKNNGSTVKVRGGAELNVKDGTVITGKDSYLGIECIASTANIYDGAEIYMNGTSSYNGCLAGVGGNGTINVYGGEGQGKSGGFIAMTSGGTINVEGGEWIANTDGTYANDNKSVLVAQSDKQYNAGAGNSIVNVTGGTFKGGYNCYGNAVGDAQINIKGGNFNANPTSYVADGYVAVENNGVWNVTKAAAKIGETEYATLQEAVDAAQDGDVVTLIADVTEDEVLITQKADVDVTIDGNDKTFTGHMTIFGSGRHTGAETLTIQNVVFQAVVDEGECIASATNINGVNSYAHNVTIDNCSFNGNDTYSADHTFAIRFPSGGVGYDLTVTGCTADNKMFGLLWVTQVVGDLIVDNCTAEGVKEGIVLTSTTKATITNTTIDASTVAIRAGQQVPADGTINEFTFNNNTLKSDAIAIQLRGDATDANLSMTENVVSGTTHISGNTADTNISADANYWGEGLTGPVVDGTNVDVNSYYADEALEQLIVTALTLQQFVEKVTEGNGTYNGTFTEGGVEKKITVKVVPVSGDARTTDDVRVPNRLQKYTNPEVYYAQYQRFSELTDVNISNVNFVFYPAAVTVTDAWNTAGATTTADNINGELQLLNTGSVLFANCSFEKMSVSPINAATLRVTSSTFNGLDAYAIKDVKATTATITGTTFTDCNGGFWFNNAPTTLTVTDNTFTGTGRRGAIQFSANGDYANTEMTVTGNEVTDDAAFLWQLNNTISNAQLNAILDKNNNTYETAFVAGSVELHLQGEGTADNPYLINDISDLEFFRDQVNADPGNNYAGKYIKLNADIDLAPTRSEINWTPIGNSTTAFQGTFDGDNHTISNLVINGGSSSNQGFFGMTTNGEIKNVIFNNAKVSGRLNVGVVAGTPYTSKYTNIKVTGHVEVNGMAYVGGVGGKNAYANWTDITVDVDDTSYVEAYSVEDGTAYRTYVGGVIGFNGEGGHTFKNITSNIKVIGSTMDVGGIFGILHYGNNAENVTFTGAVEAPADAKEVGGIAGVWHNEKGQTVTITNANSVGTVMVGDVTTTGSIVGGAYNADNETADNSGSLIIDGNEAWLKVAQIGDEKYLTLQEAVEAAQNDETITLLVDVAQADGVIIDSKNIVVDLNGKTFTVTVGASTSNRNFKIKGTSVVTIKNGTMVAAGDYSSGAYGTVRTEGTAKVTLTGLKLYNYRGNGLNIKALGGTTVDIENTEIYSQYGGGIEAAGGTITLAETVKVEQKGMYTAPYNSMAISVNGEGLVTVNGGTYSTECITAEEANNQGTSHGPWVVGVLNSGGTLIINGGTFSNDNFGDNGLATAARGAVLADTKANVQINGGTFNALAKIIDIQNNLGDADNNPVVTLKGGIYSADPTKDNAGNISNCIVLPEGYLVKPLDNGYYTVIQVAGTQTRELPDAGWYWFSTYIKYNNEETALDNLQAALGSNASLIKGQNAFTQYLNYYGTNFWTSDLTTLSTAKMYMIKTKADNVTVNLTGSFEGYANTNIELKQGWNWIGYPINEAVSLNDAIPTGALKDGDIIKDQTSSARYYVNFELPNGNTFTGWDGSLTEMKPGQGYMFKSVDEKTFSYTTSSNGTRSTLNTVDYNGDNHWFTDATQYPNNMNIVAMMSIDGKIVKGNYEVAAFANGECRGSARPIYIEALDAYVLYMTIHGEDVAELTFKYYDVNYGTEYELDNRLTYSSDAILGSLKDPYIFTMNILGIGENSIDNINIYPNPTTTDREINLQATCDKVEVFNALGVKVAEYHNVDTLDALETAGIYVIRITNDNAVKHCRLVVK